MNKVSIILPVYNVAGYLPQCLDSILAQEHTNWEAILVDDGSTDTSGEICNDYAAKDPRFRVIHQSNAGAANAKNAGLEAVSGAYVAFLDSDDYVEPNWLSKMLDTMESTGSDVVECSFTKEYLGFGEPGNAGDYGAAEFDAESYLAQYLDVWTNSLFWNKLYRADLTKSIRFRRERRCIDDEFYTYKVVSGAGKIVRIPDALYHYRQRKSSAMASLKNKRQIAADAPEVLIERYRWIRERFPRLEKNYLRHDVDIMLYFAQLSHTPETMKAFRRIARYYLGQALFKFPGAVSLLNAVKLQFVSPKVLLREQQQNTVNTDSYYP